MLQRLLHFQREAVAKAATLYNRENVAEANTQE
jgi:hypothetical protein